MVAAGNGLSLGDGVAFDESVEELVSRYEEGRLRVHKRRSFGTAGNTHLDPSLSRLGGRVLHQLGQGSGDDLLASLSWGRDLEVVFLEGLAPSGALHRRHLPGESLERPRILRVSLLCRLRLRLRLELRRFLEDVAVFSLFHERIRRLLHPRCAVPLLWQSLNGVATILLFRLESKGG